LQWQKLQQEYRLNMATNAATSLPNGHRFPHFLHIAIAQPCSLADISQCNRHVRFTPESGH
jgi:hypothetical protein